jgi:hypothetical protein
MRYRDRGAEEDTAMGLYKRCQHKGRYRDRCEHEWHGSFQHLATLHRTSLSKWANEDITSKQQAQAIYERYRQAVRDGRHEFGSRLVERGVPLSQVRDLLGHASIVTTERYDNHGFAALQQAAGRLESGKTFTSASQSVLNTKTETANPLLAADDNSQEWNKLESGGPPGDRTRDTVIKSHVLYH